MGNVRRIAHQGRLLVSLLALASVMAAIAAVPPAAAATFPRTLAAAGGSPETRTDQTGAPDGGLALSGGIRVERAAGRLTFQNSSNQAHAPARAEIAAGAFHGMHEVAAPLDGGGRHASKHGSVRTGSAGGVTVAPARVPL